MEGGSGLVVVDALLEIVSGDLARGDIAVVDIDAPVGLLVKDMVIVEECLELDLGCLVEDSSFSLSSVV